MEREPVRVHAIHYATGEAIYIEFEGGVIRAAAPSGGDGAGLPVAAPGLVDLQINGHGGQDFNRLPIDQGMLREAVRLLWREGVTSFCPTVITNSDEAIEGAMADIAQCCREDADVGRAVVGIHLEGPFISPEDGPRGAHDRRYVRSPDFEMFRRWQEVAEGRIRIVTLSPEWPGSAAFIARCEGAGVIVSIGHTAATPEQIREAAAAGARLSTHLGNGAHLILPRHPNYIWEQLAEDELHTTLIADGFHLPDSVLKVILKVKGPRAMLVSDSVSLCGMPPGNYTAAVGGNVVLTPEGKLHLAENEKLLAGSAKSLVQGINHLVRQRLSLLPEVWDMGSVRPATLLGLAQSAGLVAGAPADLVLFSRDGDRIRLEHTYKAGLRVF